MITPMTGIIGSGFFICPAEKIKQLASAAKPELIATHTGELLARAFSFALGLEVIAHGTAAHKTLPPSWMPRTVP